GRGHNTPPARPFGCDLHRHTTGGAQLSTFSRVRAPGTHGCRIVPAPALRGRGKPCIFAWIQDPESQNLNARSDDAHGTEPSPSGPGRPLRPGPRLRTGRDGVWRRAAIRAAVRAGA